MKSVAGKSFPAFRAHAQPQIYVSDKKPIASENDLLLLRRQAIILSALILPGNGPHIDEIWKNKTKNSFSKIMSSAK